MKLKNTSILIVIIILSVVPIIRWFFIDPISSRFFDLSSITTSFGQITGLLGMTLFSINLILSNRTKFFDKIFSGLHIFYNYHKQIGMISFCLLLFHPLFLVIKYISISTYDAMLFLLPGTSFAVTTGIISLSLMIILLIFTLYLKLKYHIWRMSHKILNIAFVFAIIHTMLISSDVSRDMFLRYYILTFAFIGLFSGLYRSFLRKFFNKDLEFKIIKLSILNEKVIEFELEPINQKITFIPGQFIFIRFLDEKKSSESHPFSISSSSEENTFKIVIKSLGDYTSNLKNIKIGTLAKIEGPYGSFYQNNNYKKEIWIAGGVGITPFLSMARSIKNLEKKIDLYYCVKNEKEAVLLDELNSIALLNKNFRVITWYSTDKGFITADIIEKESGGLKEVGFFMCGPIMFMRTLRKQFIKKGVDKNNINFEEFNFL